MLSRVRWNDRSLPNRTLKETRPRYYSRVKSETQIVSVGQAINAYMWQNGGHSGMDQWGFVMHPVFAAKQCDPDGDYVRRWVPELAQLPRDHIHSPWDAPLTMLAGAKLRLVHCGDARSPRSHAHLGLRANNNNNNNNGGLAGGTTSLYPHRVLVDLDKARRRTHDAVLAVRRSPAGQALISSDGTERIQLADGRTVKLITRIDFREDSDKPITFQTADADRDKARRRPQNTFQRLMHDDLATTPERA